MSRGMDTLFMLSIFSSVPPEIDPPFLSQSCFIFRNCFGVGFCFCALL